MTSALEASSVCADMMCDVRGQYHCNCYHDTTIIDAYRDTEQKEIYRVFVSYHHEQKEIYRVFASYNHDVSKCAFLANMPHNSLSLFHPKISLLLFSFSLVIKSVRDEYLV